MNFASRAAATGPGSIAAIPRPASLKRRKVSRMKGLLITSQMRYFPQRKRLLFSNSRILGLLPDPSQSICVLQRNTQSHSAAFDRRLTTSSLARLAGSGTCPNGQVISDTGYMKKIMKKIADGEDRAIPPEKPGTRKNRRVNGNY